MALLHYQNLGVSRPDILLSRAFYGLKPFYDFLRGTKAYLESDAAVKRLAWVPGTAPDGEPPIHGATGYWVLLQPSPDRPNEPEATFREFMDENVRSVFESGTRRYGREEGIEVLDRDPETGQLRLASLPRTDQILLRPATLTLHRQIQALQALQEVVSRRVV